MSITCIPNELTPRPARAFFIEPRKRVSMSSKSSTRLTVMSATGPPHRVAAEGLTGGPALAGEGQELPLCRRPIRLHEVRRAHDRGHLRGREAVGERIQGFS